MTIKTTKMFLRLDEWAQSLGKSQERIDNSAEVYSIC